MLFRPSSFLNKPMGVFNVMEPDAEVPEVYRSSPFEHATTAEAEQLLMACTEIMPSSEAWVAVAGFVRVAPPLPGWMAGRSNARAAAQSPFEQVLAPLFPLPVVTLQFDALPAVAPVSTAMTSCSTERGRPLRGA